MALQQLFTSRKNYEGATYIARYGRMFYDEATGQLRLGDGVTPGGKIISNLSLAAVSTTPPINPYEGELWYNPVSKELWAYYNGAFRGTINPATTSTLGGVKLGPGITLNGDNQIIIDSSGLDFAFGDFYAFTNTGPSDGACLGSINPDQDINIISNGTGTVNVVGEFNVHKTNATVEEALTFAPVFAISSVGQVRILVPNPDTESGSVEIVGGTNGTSVAPKQPGVMLHVTGLSSTTSVASRIYNDGQNNLAAYVGRRYNGSAVAPTAVKAGETIMRISAVGYGATTMPDFGSSRISFVAEENYTDSAQGGRLEFYTNPIGGTVLTAVATMTNALGIWATKFTGPLTGNISGNLRGTAVTATNFYGTFNGVATTATYAQSFNTATLVTTAVNASLATTATYAQSFNTGTLITTAVNASLATTATYAQSFNTGTLVTTAVTSLNSLFATTATYAQSFNTGTLVTYAVTATTAATVTAASQPLVTSLGTLTSLSVNGAVNITSVNYNINLSPAGSGTVIINPATAGTMSNVSITLPAGTSSTPPLKFTSDSLLTTATTGAMEFNGNSLFFTPSSTMRGMIATPMVFILDQNRSYTPGTKNLQPTYGVGVSVTPGRYRFIREFSISKNGGGNHTLQVGTLGTAQISRISYRYETIVSGATTVFGSYNSATSVAQTVSGNLGAGQIAAVRMTGVCDISSSGTLIPAVGWDTDPTDVIVYSHSLSEIWPVGSTGNNTVIGNWA